jgi:hypothetical protein
MRGTGLPRYFLAGALGLGLAAGCSHQRPIAHRDNPPGPAVCSHCGPANQSEMLAAAGPALTAPEAPKPAPKEVPVPAPTIMFSWVQASPIPSVPPPPTVAVGTHLPLPPQEGMAAVRTKPAPGVAKATPAEPVRQASFGQASSKPGLIKLERPSTLPQKSPAAAAPEPASRPRFGHASDYRWVRGQVQDWYHGTSWRVRYLPVDETDDFGGSVTLIGTSRELAGLKDGQFVQVKGAPCHGGRSTIAPGYRIESIQILNAAK